MGKIKSWIKAEMNAEFFGSVHGMSLIWVYGFLTWVCKIDSVSFLFIFEMFLLGYIIAWFQNLLFLKDKAYKKYEYKGRVILWNIGPTVLIIIAQIVLNWFEQVPIGIAIIFDLIMFIYFIIMWVFIKIFYEDDTQELNQLLGKYKTKKEN